MATSQPAALRFSCDETDGIGHSGGSNDHGEALGAHRELAALWRTWEQARSGRVLPCRRDFTPERLRPWLGSLALIDVDHDPIRLQFRLVGVHIVDNLKFDPTGKAVEDFVTDPANDPMTRGLYRCLMSAQPVFEVVCPQYQCRHAFRCNRLALPLSADGLTVNKIMVGEYAIPPGCMPARSTRRERPRLTAAV